MIEIRHIERGDKGVFSLLARGQPAGELTYHHAGKGVIIIDHTGVPSSYGGLGYGKQLVKAAVAYARQIELKVIAHCSFAQAVISKTPEYRDVLEDPSAK